jgi:hypothetical protein
VLSRWLVILSHGVRGLHTTHYRQTSHTDWLLVKVFWNAQNIAYNNIFYHFFKN